MLKHADTVTHKSNQPTESVLLPPNRRLTFLKSLIIPFEFSNTCKRARFALIKMLFMARVWSRNKRRAKTADVAELKTDYGTLGLQSLRTALGIP